MGIGFVIFIWAIIGLLALAFYLLLVLLARWSPAAATLKRVMPITVAAVAIPIVLVIMVNYGLDLLPSHVFKSSFGFAAPADVKELQGRRFILGDGGDAYLRFRASAATVDRIVAGRFVEVVGSETKCDQFFAADELSPDWQPPGGKSVRCFRALSREDGFGSGFGSNSASLLYDPQSGTAYFHWSGID